ncbi:glyoxalase [Paenibacillus sp. FSL R7-0273]|uniref:VOC family protein n=1 Tax=Paenibacillus sp. FSL R7-0273 TaxID=1536772 RepID=UPI0004F7BBFB|nr:VOC family protein [Paenibacillus sp. FSL R7-0273]AIQ47292.1 glyoxalase [Paenibacillus sp. FSL R7-0273]OMF91608.1 glyoxalase [Paenibacillus sp. FSL R7-0273]
MRIEHVAMYVHNLESAKQFFVTFFQAIPGELYHNPVTGLRTYFLTFEGGARLEIMNRPDMEQAKGLKRTGLIHLAFSVGSTARVDALTEELKEAGYTVLSGPRTTGDGYYESCVLGFEDNQIEITV